MSQRRVALIFLAIALLVFGITSLRAWRCENMGWGADFDFCAALAAP